MSDPGLSREEQSRESFRQFCPNWYAMLAAAEKRAEDAERANSVRVCGGDHAVRYLQDDAECPYCEVDRYMAQRDELAERVKTELTAIERWAGEQNAGNVFAEQVRFWARSKLAALARLDSEGAEA